MVYCLGSRHVIPKANVVSTVGCGTATDNVKISVYKVIFIPNAFTPNNDGINDVFHIMPIENYKVNKFSIYNRWGKLMFETNDARNGWDGTFGGEPAPSGVYVYYIEMQNRKKKISKKGTVVFLR